MITIPKRIQLSRAAGWRKPPGVLSVGRPSIWGNPWVGPDAVEAYRRFLEQLVFNRSVSHYFHGLDVNFVFGKPIDCAGVLRQQVLDYICNPVDVACWCPLDKPCHGNVIRALPHYAAWLRAGNGVPK